MGQSTRRTTKTRRTPDGESARVRKRQRRTTPCCKGEGGESSSSSVRFAAYLGAARFVFDVVDRLGQWLKHMGH
jgi:hypothetical protein